MHVDAAITDAIRREAASLRATADRLERLVLPLARPAEVAATPADGQVREGQIFLSGGWVSLRPQRLKLLAWAFGQGVGATVEEVCAHLMVKRTRQVAAVLAAQTNRQIDDEIGVEKRRPHVSLKGGLHVIWLEVGEESQETA